MGLMDISRLEKSLKNLLSVTTQWVAPAAISCIESKGIVSLATPAQTDLSILSPPSGPL